MTTFATPGAALPAAARPQRRWLFVGRDKWQTAIFVATVAALLCYPLYENDTLWLGAGVAVIALIVWHSLVVSRRLPWIPGLALLTAALQWVIAPWVTYHIGASFVRFEMAVPATEYFRFAVPALAALAAGIAMVLRKEGRAAALPAPSAGECPPRLRRTCDVMVAIGLITQLVIAPLAGAGGLAFLLLLVANLGFVGALTLMIAGARRWSLRVLLVLGVQALIAASNGMFHDLVLWATYVGLTYVYARRLRPSAILTLAAAALAGVMVLNVIKRPYRETIASTQMGLFARAGLLGNTIVESATDPDLAYEGSGLRFNATRLNQGWIIARVLYWVPNREPYADGETIGAAVRATLLPRVVDPGKLEIGGRTYFERFTGVALGRAAMDLSLAGEMYANFGFAGALLGIFFFGALLGGVYRLFLRWSRRSPLWWAWAPYVLLYSTKAENSVAEVTNYVFKASVIMVVVIATVPAWAQLRHSLGGGRFRRVNAPTRTLPSP